MTSQFRLAAWSTRASLVKATERQWAIWYGLSGWTTKPLFPSSIHSSAQAVEVPNHGASKGFRIHRVGANRWELVRTSEGWKIQRRTLRPLDGTEPARELLRSALKAYDRG